MTSSESSLERQPSPEEIAAQTLKYCEEDGLLKLAIATGIAAVQLCRVAESFVQERLQILGCSHIPAAFAVVVDGVRTVGDKVPDDLSDLASRILNYALPFVALRASEGQRPGSP